MTLTSSIGILNKSLEFLSILIDTQLLDLNLNNKHKIGWTG